MHGRGPIERDQAASEPILIVDDDREYCAFVSDVLLRGRYNSHAVSTGEEALAFASRQRPAAVILDAILPGATGYAICRKLRDEHGAELPIVFVSGKRTEPADRVVGLLLGADDYILKPFDPDELLVRVRRLIARSTARTDDVTRAAAVWELTSRESKVLRLLAEGLSQDEIALHLDIRPATVGSHIQHMLTKLNVHSRTQAVALAYRERLFERSAPLSGPALTGGWVEASDGLGGA